MRKLSSLSLSLSFEIKRSIFGIDRWNVAERCSKRNVYSLYSIGSVVHWWWGVVSVVLEGEVEFVY